MSECKILLFGPVFAARPDLEAEELVLELHFDGHSVGLVTLMPATQEQGPDRQDPDRQAGSRRTGSRLTGARSFSFLTALKV